VVWEIAIGIGLALAMFLIINGVDITPYILLAALLYLFRYLLEQRTPKRFETVGGGRTGSFREEISFDDIGGQEVAKKEFLEALSFITESEKANSLGIRPIKGILLTGPPGNGKTLLAKAAATFVDGVFIATSGSQFVEMYAGVGAKRVRRLFEEAKESAIKKKKKYAIIFIDEIEVLGGIRGRNTSHLEYDQTLNELLVQMDGINSNNTEVRILVIAATNREDLLDSALHRPGRFDRTVYVDKPDYEGRVSILSIHAKGKPLAGDVDIKWLAKQTYGFSGAHLESMLNEAAIMAFRDGRQELTRQDCLEAIDKVMMGEKLERRPRPEERERIAYHETGHALLSEIVRAKSVSVITITSRGRALGYIRQSPEEDVYLLTRDDILNQIAVSLAGSVAEEIFFGSYSTGCSGDFEQALKYAEHLIKAGMSDLGLVIPDNRSCKFQEQVQNILHHQREYVFRQIEACKDKLQSAACLLLERETLMGDEFREIIGELITIPKEEPAVESKQVEAV
jgi:cell division protease FtsH